MNFLDTPLHRNRLSLVASLAMCFAIIGASSRAVAQYAVAPNTYTGAYVPIGFNQQAVHTSALDPYQLVGARRTLPWLGGYVGSPAPQAASVAHGPGCPDCMQGNANVLSGAGLFGNGPSWFGQSNWGANLRNNWGANRPLIGNGRLFPQAYNRVNDRLWLRAEWLLWDTKGMDTPALVSTSTAGTTRDIAGVLGEPGSSVLFGDRELNGGTVSGLRLGGGFWITPQKNFAIESEYFQLGEQDDRFSGDSDGSVILGRPFFDIVAGQETAQLLAYPGLASGDIRVRTESNLRSFMVNGRASLCPCGSGCNSCGVPDRVDWIVGFRHVQLDDAVTINENLNSLIPTAPGTIAVSDRFRTENEFNGLQLGVVHRSNFQRAWLESMLRVALGNNQQKIRISGSNTITEAGLTDTLNGGLLAQRTNIGNHRRDKFTMIPEVGVRFGFRLTQCLHATVGYSVIYFPNVVRAGDQIDTDLNPGLVPPEADPLVGALRPRLRFIESDYWAHGLTLGGELAF